MSHHPTPRESHLAHEDSRNEVFRKLRQHARLVEATDLLDRFLRAGDRKDVEKALKLIEGVLA